LIKGQNKIEFGWILNKRTRLFETIKPFAAIFVACGNGFSITIVEYNR
jgi:hypothetical protein